MNNHNRLYQDLSWTWPIISPPEDYIEETEVLCNALREYSQIEIYTLLNLGCGGGHNDYTLKKHFEVTGVDLSESMLSLAKRLNPEVTYLYGDMRTVRLEQHFDAVVIADSINYMATEDDLRAAFVTAFTHLNPGGILFTFAEITSETFRQHQTECSTHVRDDLEITFIENYYDPDPADTSLEATLVYLIRQGGRLTIETDHHIVGIFRLETWSRLLTAIGFEVHHIELEGYDFATFVGLKR